MKLGVDRPREKREKKKKDAYDYDKDTTILLDESTIGAGGALPVGWLAENEHHR